MFSSFCFSDDPDWNPGVVVLENNNMLEGDIKFDHKNGVIQCRDNGKIKAFSSHGVVYFYFINKVTNILHRFISVEQSTKDNYHRKDFYEIVLEGELTLLRKRNKAIDPVRRGQTSSTDNMMHHILCYDYYVYYEGEMLEIDKFKKDIVPLMEDKDQEIQKYADRKNLRLYYLMDQISLISYYNGLVFADNGHPQKSLSYNLPKEF